MLPRNSVFRPLVKAVEKGRFGLLTPDWRVAKLPAKAPARAALGTAYKRLLEAHDLVTYELPAAPERQGEMIRQLAAMLDAGAQVWRLPEPTMLHVPNGGMFVTPDGVHCAIYTMLAELPLENFLTDLTGAGFQALARASLTRGHTHLIDASAILLHNGVIGPSPISAFLVPTPADAFGSGFTVATFPAMHVAENEDLVHWSPLRDAAALERFARHFQEAVSPDVAAFMCARAIQSGQASQEEFDGIPAKHGAVH